MLIFGKRLYGKVLACGPSHVATWFFHLWFIPLIPLGSVIVLEKLDGDRLRLLPTRLHWASLGLAYFRAWSVFFLLHGLFNLGDPENGAYYGAAVAIAAVVGIVVSFFVLGRTSADTRARLETYGRVFGHPIDLGLLRAEGDGVRSWLREQLIASGRTIAMTYREMYDPATQWGAIALDPSMTDRNFLACALCLARAERATVAGAERAAFDTLHDRIWERLRALNSASVPVTPSATHTQP